MNSVEYEKLPPIEMIYMTSDEFRRMFSGDMDPDEIEAFNMAYEDAKGKVPMDMTHMTSDEFCQMFSGHR